MKTNNIKIGIVGLGTVGMAVLKTLQKNRAIVRARSGVNVDVRWAVNRSRTKLRASGLPKDCVAQDYRAVIDDPDVKIVVELIGGTTDALEVVLAALKAGKHVVTANKALLAKHWRRIFSVAAKHGCAVRYESSVMSGVPVIRALKDGLAGNAIRSVFGILNGTSNFVLSRIANAGMEFAPALEEARRLGFCEANASLDIDGFDAAQKLSILGSIVLKKWLPPSKIYREGISHITLMDLLEARQQFGYVVRPLAVLKCDGKSVEARVHPTFVPEGSALASVDNELNAILINADTAGPVLMTGRGAGDKAAASGVVSDIAYLAGTIHRGGHDGVFAPMLPEAGAAAVKPMKDVESKYYLRFTVVDQPNVFSFIAGALGKHNVSIATCHQRGRSERGPVPIFMITHHAREGALRKALKEVDSARRMVKRKTVAIRIEE